MARWTKPTEEMPECDVGDRVLIIVVERPSAGKKLRPWLVVLEATEDGWTCDDPTFRGYSVEDGVLWSLEKDVCGIAYALELVP